MSKTSGWVGLDRWVKYKKHFTVLVTLMESNLDGIKLWWNQSHIEGGGNPLVLYWLHFSEKSEKKFKTSSGKFALERQIWSKDEAWKWKDVQKYSPPPQNFHQWRISQIPQIRTNDEFLRFFKFIPMMNFSYLSNLDKCPMVIFLLQISPIWRVWELKKVLSNSTAWIMQSIVIAKLCSIAILDLIWLIDVRE